MKCIICRENEATLPDRNTMSKRKKICSECHADRLKMDLRYILHVNFMNKEGHEGKNK